jgi:hypothetical protein
MFASPDELPDELPDMKSTAPKSKAKAAQVDELPDLEGPASSNPEMPEELPDLEEHQAKKESQDLEELPDLEGKPEKKEPASFDELPDIEAKPKESIEEMPEIETPAEKPVKPAKPAVPQKPALKPAPAKKDAAPAKPAVAEPVPMAKQVAAQASAPSGVTVSAFFSQSPTNPKKYVDEGFGILATIAKANHSGEEIGANLERFKDVLKDIVGFSQSMFPMTNTARSLRKVKKPLEDGAVKDLLTNIQRWKGEILDKMK